MSLIFELEGKRALVCAARSVTASLWREPCDGSLLGSTRTRWRPAITLWQSVRWQLQQLAAGLVRYWVWRILQLAGLLQDFLLKLNIRMPCRRTSLLETSVDTNCVPLPKTTRNLWRPSIAIDSLPVLRCSAWRGLQQFIADLVRCLVIRPLQLALRRADRLFSQPVREPLQLPLPAFEGQSCLLLLGGDA